MKIQRIIRSLAAAALAAVMLFAAPPIAVHAEDLTLETDINKKLEIPLTLDADTDDFYMNANINPGDVLTADVVFKNKSKNDIQVRISDVKDQFQTTMSAKLLQILKLNIEVDGKVSYNGSHAKVTSPLTQWITLKGGKSMTMKIRIEFPKEEADNTFQGAEMKVKYVFEARADVPSDPPKTNETIKTGIDDVESTNKMAALLIGGAVLAVGCVAVYIIVKKKKDSEDN